MTETVDIPNVQAAPESLRRIGGNIDVAFASAIFDMATENDTGATSGIVYESTDSDEYKDAVKLWRKHLATRIDPDKQRVKVVPFVAGDGVSFSVQIAVKTKRETK